MGMDSTTWTVPPPPSQVIWEGYLNPLEGPLNLRVTTDTTGRLYIHGLNDLPVIVRLDQHLVWEIHAGLPRRITLRRIG